MLGGETFKQQNHQQKVWKYENYDIKLTENDTLVYSMRSETRGQNNA